MYGKSTVQALQQSNSEPNKGTILAELSSCPKGRRAEPNNYRARIEIEKTMRLSQFMVVVASGMAGGRVRLATTTTTTSLKMAAILQKKLDLGILRV